MREMRYVEDNRRQTTEIEVRVSECTDVAYCFLDYPWPWVRFEGNLWGRLKGDPPGYGLRRIATAEIPALMLRCHHYCLTQNKIWLHLLHHITGSTHHIQTTGQASISISSIVHDYGYGTYKITLHRVVMLQSTLEEGSNTTSKSKESKSSRSNQPPNTSNINSSCSRITISSILGTVSTGSRVLTSDTGSSVVSSNGRGHSSTTGRRGRGGGGGSSAGSGGDSRGSCGGGGAEEGVDGPASRSGCAFDSGGRGGVGSSVGGGGGSGSVTLGSGSDLSAPITYADETNEHLRAFLGEDGKSRH
jgi:hypothetical protein